MSVAQILQQFGFTEVEARAYMQLCTEAPATGYELAKALQASRANVYSALESLVAKGAAEKTPTSPVKYVPVPPDDLVARLTARSTAALAELRRELPRPTQAPPDEFWVTVGTDAILEKAVEVICGAQELLMADLWEEEANILAPALEAAEQRGIRVTLTVIGESQARLRRIYRHTRDESWAAKGRTLTLIADGTRVLTGTVGARAICTTDPALVELAENSLFRDMLVLELQRRHGLSDEALMEAEQGILK